MAKILVVEDEADICELLVFHLSDRGHKVMACGTGQEAIQFVKSQAPDLMLLDLMLPDISGLEVCRLLKSNSLTKEVKIIMATAKGEEIDRVVGFELGADDYVVKPFSMREVGLRVEAVLRRGQKESDPKISPRFDFGVLKVDREAHRLWSSGQEVELTALEFKLLILLYDRKNRVQTRGVLLSDVWGIDAEITTRTVDTHVKRLREKLGKAGTYIETVRGVGYRFVSEIT